MVLFVQKRSKRFWRRKVDLVSPGSLSGRPRSCRCGLDHRLRLHWAPLIWWWLMVNMLLLWSVRRWHEKSWTKQDGPDHHTDERVSPNTLQYKYQIHSKNQIRYSKNQILHPKNQIRYSKNQIDHRKNQLVIINWMNGQEFTWGFGPGLLYPEFQSHSPLGGKSSRQGFHNMGTEILNRKLWIMLSYLGGEMNSLISLRKYLTTCNKWNIWQVWTWAKIYVPWWARRPPVMGFNRRVVSPPIVWSINIPVI